jgi:ABC-type antimicrobial peptide transport system ATPase subunit
MMDLATLLLLIAVSVAAMVGVAIRSEGARPRPTPTTVLLRGPCDAGQTLDLVSRVQSEDGAIVETRLASVACEWLPRCVVVERAVAGKNLYSRVGDGPLVRAFWGDASWHCP